MPALWGRIPCFGEMEMGPLCLSKAEDHSLPYPGDKSLHPHLVLVASSRCPFGRPHQVPICTHFVRPELPFRSNCGKPRWECPCLMLHRAEPFSLSILMWYLPEWRSAEAPLSHDCMAFVLVPNLGLERSNLLPSFEGPHRAAACGSPCL